MVGVSDEKDERGSPSVSVSDVNIVECQSSRWIKAKTMSYQLHHLNGVFASLVCVCVAMVEMCAFACA